jgi:uncharacterized membrane protein
VRSRPSLVAAAGIVLGGAFIAALWLQVVLSDASLATTLISHELWASVVRRFGPAHGLRADVTFGPLFGLTAGISVLLWLTGGLLLRGLRGVSFRDALGNGSRAWLWALPLCAALGLSFVPASAGLLEGTLPLWPALSFTGWTTHVAALLFDWRLDRPSAVLPEQELSRRVPWAVWLAMAVYVAVFGALTVGLWQALRIPHGDSAMYEEHLWNLLHGKGFRSYLDNGRLFLGEHLQIVHVLLLPLYVLWPHHLLLEFCQSMGLAAGAIPVFWIAQRHSGSRTAATLLALAYLLYMPMQFLDIAVDFKTFRPNAFEIPFLLFGLDALERGRVRQFLVWVALTLSCQEDAAPVLAPLGIWIAVANPIQNPKSRIQKQLLGLFLALFSVVYLVMAIRFVLPAFRAGGDVHFANYFSELGRSSGEIVQNLFRDPGRFAARFFRVETLLFGLALLLPVGGLPLLSPGRLAVGVPLFAVLCLSNVTDDPRHHFHAPLVPIVVWAAAAGLGRVVPAWNRALSLWHRGQDSFRQYLRFRLQPNGKWLPGAQPSRPRMPAALGVAGCVALCLALVVHALSGMTPLGLAFWDPGSPAHWRIYLPDERTERFPAASALVPRNARVASTDFVHPRFTHHERSYDYSDYRPVLPADTEYIVIDTLHPYSRIQRVEQVKEFRDHPDDWEVLMEGAFLVLKRRQGSSVQDARR